MTDESLAVLDELIGLNGLSKSEAVRQSIAEKHEGESLMRSSTITKADEIVSKFMDNVAKSNEGDWLTVRNHACELLMKRASILHPSLSPAEAMAQVA